MLGRITSVCNYLLTDKHLDHKDMIQFLLKRRMALEVHVITMPNVGE